VVTPQGEDKPLASNENEIGRQLNRRVEFYIIGGPNYKHKAMTYIIEPKNTLPFVAKKFNMTVAEIKDYNGLEDDKLVPYTPLRVKRSSELDIIAPSTLAQVDTKDRKIVESDKQVVTASNGQTTTIVETQEPVAVEQGGYYIVQPKNTLYSIARKFKMKPEELMALNGLESNNISIGQRLKVKAGTGTSKTTTEPVSGEYIVKKGDTMYSIARNHRMTVPELQEINHLKNFKVIPGMVLKVRE
jgi:LysM repeat protein